MMQLRRKIMIYVGLITFALLALLYLISEKALLHHYEALELRDSEEETERALLSFYDEFHSLDAVSIGYASWDETYRFVKRQGAPAADDPYLKSNFTDSLYEAARLNYTVLLNGDNEVYYARGYDYEGKRELAYPQTLIDAMRGEYADDGGRPGDSAGRTGLAVIGGLPMMVASYPILTSGDRGPAEGRLVFARLLDEGYIHYIAGKADIPIDIDVLDDSFALPGEAGTIAVQNREPMPYWTANDKRSIASYAVLPDIRGEYAALLTLEKPMALYKQAKKSVEFYMLFFGLTGIGFFVIARLVLQWTIFGRLNRVIRGMREIETEKDFSIRIPESGKDEIAQLERSFNLMTASLQHAQKRIRYQTYHDTLTGLSNRLAFYERLEETIALSGKTRARFAVILIDIDSFKWVNDTLGHQSGDLLLLKTSKRLKRCLKGGGSLFRLGGDEFCIISPKVQDKKQIDSLAQRIKDELSEPFEIEGNPVIVTASIGISLYPEHGTESEALLHYSDVAMLDVKERGRNQYRWYSQAIEANRTRRALIEHLLRNAIDKEELQLYFQPKWDLSAERISGMETLLRWKNDRLGQVSPAEFIPIAESSGLINEIGEWIMHAACRQFKAWREQLDELSVVIAINISGAQLLQPNFAERIGCIFAEERVDPSRFELEVTESFAIENFDEVNAIFVELRNMGFTISIDDFGAGYSSLKYVSRLPIQCMKIDKTLIDHISDDERSRVIVSSLIDMAHRLKLVVVAEGVELPEQLELLKSYHCDQIQGFLFCKPMPADQISGFMQAN
ncbi:putative bifunctional diguanylate cyclase/phosphodiesterase [Paenibacillus arenilitoris]|uniref:EAL domain-containing protein n=1 Tax=Paenibacillus arenilitoris TaxID=2772299 RepID=A0A927CKK3_9BACL|nr:EAL domain-containing protein [Paenibacillus arenilitoris]MBD2868887.1 EAL domain-containing protein [Paenibacillus arenilitoris]